MLDTKEPIRLAQDTPPDAPDERDENVTITISQTAIYFILVGVICFVAGFFVAWMLSAASNANANQAFRATAMIEAASTAQAGAAAQGGGPLVQANIPIGTSPAWGVPDAKVTIVEYSDFQCPFCERYFQDTYQLIQQNYGSRVKYVFKHFPLSGHPDAFPAALASECAHEQGKFWQFHNIAYSNQSDLSRAGLIQKAQAAGVGDMNQFVQCLDTRKYASTVQQNMTEGSNFGIGGTPTFFINGVPLVGAQPYAAFQQAIDRALQAAGG